MISFIKEMWSESKTPLEYLTSLWISGLVLLFWVAWIGIIYHLITSPSSFSNASFGIFDYV
jgi:hypothetical protein